MTLSCIRYVPEAGTVGTATTSRTRPAKYTFLTLTWGGASEMPMAGRDGRDTTTLLPARGVPSMIWSTCGRLGRLDVG